MYVAYIQKLKRLDLLWTNIIFFQWMNLGLIVQYRIMKYMYRWIGYTCRPTLVVICDRSRHGRGVALYMLYIRSDIPFSVRNDLTLDKEPKLESCWIEIETKNKVKLLLCSMYRPPSANSAFYNVILETFFNDLTEENELIVWVTITLIMLLTKVC